MHAFELYNNIILTLIIIIIIIIVFLIIFFSYVAISPTVFHGNKIKLRVYIYMYIHVTASNASCARDVYPNRSRDQYDAARGGRS